MGSLSFTKVVKVRLQDALDEHRSNPKYAAVLAEADERGYRLAEVWERQFMDERDLFSWRGTVWVRK